MSAHVSFFITSESAENIEINKHGKGKKFGEFMSNGHAIQYIIRKLEYYGKC